MKLIQHAIGGNYLLGGDNRFALILIFKQIINFLSYLNFLMK